jgi:hypothetical protein
LLLDDGGAGVLVVAVGGALPESAKGLQAALFAYGHSLSRKNGATANTSSARSSKESDPRTLEAWAMEDEVDNNKDEVEEGDMEEDEATSLACSEYTDCAAS